MNPFQERIDMIRLQLTDSDLLGQVQRLREELDRLEGATALACPSCKHSDGLADVTVYPGVCDGTFARLRDGSVDFEGDGETDVCWEAGVAPANGESVQCDCGWTGKPEQLIVYIEDDEPECEDCSVNGEDCRVHGAAYKAARQAIAANPDKTLAVLVAAGLAEQEEA